MKGGLESKECWWDEIVKTVKRVNRKKTPKNLDIVQHNCPPADTQTKTRDHTSGRRVIYPLVR